MKKHLLFALGLAVAAGSLTSCHSDDGDDDGNVSGDFSDNITVMTMPSMLSNYTDNLGASAYMLSDGSINVFTFVTGTSQDNPIVKAFETGSVESAEEGAEDETYAAVDKTALSSSDFPAIYDCWYGGFAPTWKAKADEDAYDFVTPIDGTFSNDANCLIANPGTVCKAIFTKNLSSPLAYLTMKKALKLSVQAPKIYKDLKDAADSVKTAKENLEAWDLTTLPANTKIEVIVYGYVESFNMSNIKSALNSLKKAGKGMASGGSELGRVTLIETDANGKVTTLCDSWQEIVFSKQTYLGEVYMKVTQGSKDVTATFFDANAQTSLLNYVLVDKITFQGRSLF